ncbi:hypothetical protein POM88_008420 [Heracleum sosnowskyi]|uniref:ATP-dependent DNA helicase n=1 Tax=Heracleum sosnowskyi TaxID=360622 RepID=A0AAD8J6C9_9APIA|nr:hypothetical protein POM88_008420 [Heracleum sosnowskyi]
MEPAQKKRGRPKLFLTKEMVQERKTAKRLCCNSRRNGGSRQHCSGSSNSGGFVGGNKSFNKVITVFMKIRMFRGDLSGNNIAHEEHENVESHIGGTSDTGDLSGSSIAGEEHENAEAHVGGTSDTGDSNSILDMGKQDQTCGFCEAQVWAAEFTGRYVGTGPKGYSICCGKGKVQLPFLRETPSELGELLTSGSRLSRMFFPKSRVYNNIFAFCSFGGKIDDSVNKGKGPYVFRVSGETYHNFGSLVAPDSCAPKFAQIYMYDGQQAIDHRVNFVGTKDVLDPTIIATLQEMLNRENFLVGVFKQAQQRFDGVDEIPVRLRLLERRTTDGRFENIPTHNDYEFAGLTVDNDFANYRDIVAEDKKLGLKHISDLHPCFMSMQYPLLFPYGEDDAMMNDFTKNNVLGCVLAVVYTIEFQKRGLPHAHIVLWLANDDKLVTPEQIDEVICAELPDELGEPVGYKAVSQFMMHGPCGAANPKCPCMYKGRCSRLFPKAFCDDTTMDADGYALYRRRNTKTTVECNNILLDNRHVVPYHRVNDRKIEFRDWVLGLGDGTEPTYLFGEDVEPSWIKIPDELNLAYTGDPMDAIVNEVYGDLQHMHGSVEYLRDRAILTPLNEFVESVNNSVLHRLTGDFRAYKSCDSICKASSGSAADEASQFHELLIAEKDVPLIVVITGLMAKKISEKVLLSSSDATRLYANIDYTPVKDLRNAIAAATGNAAENLPKPTYNRFVSADETTLQELTIKEILETTLPNSTAVLRRTCEATIVAILQGEGWYYNCCPRCSRKVQAVEGDYYCNNCAKEASDFKPRYKVIVRVEDTSARTTFTLFNKEAEQLIGVPAPGITVIPPIINNIIGKKCAFDIKINSYNTERGYEEYTVYRLSECPETTKETAASHAPSKGTKRQKTG